jgi:SAM-dependent methyltransferase
MSEQSQPSVSDPEWWDQHYRRGDTGWDIGQGAPPFARWLRAGAAAAESLKVAVLGSGLGNDALLFARTGYEVTGFDFSPSAVASAVARAREEGVAVRFEQADIFDLPRRYRGAFDLVVEHTCFCAIDPARRAEYARVAHDILAPEGRLVGLFYVHGQPGGPPFTTSPEEVLRLFTPHFHVHELEWAPDSVERRAGKELFVVFFRRD